MGLLKFSCIQISIVLLVFTLTKSSTKASAIPKDMINRYIADERSAILAFKAGLSDPSNLLSSWKGDNYCQWKGVQCSNTTGHIVKLDLQGPDCSNSDVSIQVLGGSISSSVIGLQHLQYLDLSCNRFNMVQIPVFLSAFHELQYLDLSLSSFVGRIPPQLGSIPKSFVNCKGMTRKGEKDDFKAMLGYRMTFGANEMVYYTENITVVTKGQERIYTGEIIYMVNLDLSCNKFTGEIPAEIGTLVALANLNLSWNAFSGKIPATIGDLVQVESLDLSQNELSGEIPTSLSALTYLSHLNLSYNNLSGTIPSGNQLQVLDDQASIYIGNPGLCGPPLSKKCPEAGLIPPAPEDHKDGSDNVFLFVSTSSGFVMGLWTVFCIFLFKAKWRIVCFSFSDRLYDWVYVQVAVGWASLARKMGRRS